ncbi:MAG: Bug family tripartite tricarboxylate transporter substrate binding protein [Lautropia sp.]
MARKQRCCRRPRLASSPRNRKSSTTGDAMPLSALMSRVAVLAIATLIPLSGSAAEPYPAKPVRLVVGFAPGGFHDMVARLIAEKLAPDLGQPVIVDNRPGAGGTLGAAHVASSAPDGYTLLVGAVSNVAIAPNQFKGLKYDPIRDFAPVRRVAAIPNILVVHRSFGPRTVKELVELARQNPGQISYASAGLGTSSHLMVEALNVLTGIKLHHVPYKGEAPGTADVVGGHVSMIFASPPLALPHLKAGALNALAVSTQQRSSLVPDIPTVAESGGPADFDVSVWLGVLAPAGTPREIVELLDTRIAAALRKPDVREKLAGFGAESPAEDGPQAFAAYIKAEVERWAAVASAAGIKPE